MPFGIDFRNNPPGSKPKAAVPIESLTAWLTAALVYYTDSRRRFLINKTILFNGTCVTLGMEPLIHGAWVTKKTRNDSSKTQTLAKRRMSLLEMILFWSPPCASLRIALPLTPDACWTVEGHSAKSAFFNASSLYLTPDLVASDLSWETDSEDGSDLAHLFSADPQMSREGQPNTGLDLLLALMGTAIFCAFLYLSHQFAAVFMH